VLGSKEEEWSEGHLCLVSDSHIESDPHESLQNWEQLPNEHRSNTFKTFKKKIWKYQFLHLKQMKKKKNHCGCKREGIECYFEPEEMMRFWRQYQEGVCVVYFSLIVSFWLFLDRSRIELFFWRRIGPVLMVMRRKMREKKSDRRR